MEFNVFKLEQQNGSNRITFEDRVPFKSVVWEEHFNDLGKLQAVFPKTSDALSLIKVGKFCTITPELYTLTSRLMYIQSIKITDTEVWAYGSDARVLWKKAAMMNIGDNYGDYDIKTRIENAILTYGNFSFLNANSVVIPNVGTANLDALKYENVYDFVTQALNKVNGGWYVSFDEPNGVVGIYARLGTDKSETVRFATILGNAAKTEYTKDNQSYVNRVYCVGKSGDDVVIERYDQTNSDGEIYSAYLDVRTDFPKPDNMTLADYKEALQIRAQMSCISRHARETVKISDIDALEFGTAYVLGDIVGVVLDDLNMTVNRRVTGIKRVIEGNIDKLTVEVSPV